MARGKNENQLDAEPLLDYIESTGGVHHLMNLALERSKLEKMRVEKLMRGIRQRGYVDLFMLDDILMGYYGVHPVTIYGSEWWSPTFYERRKQERQIMEVAA